MTTALVISGGGCKGAFGVGALEVLLGSNPQIDFIVGTSTGALIAPLVAIGDVDKLVEIYTSVRTKDIVRSNWRRLWYNALKDTTPLERLIRKTMKGPRFEQLQLSPIGIYLCAVNLYLDEVHYFSPRNNEAHPDVRTWRDFDEFVRCVLASTNQPFLMPPSKVQGQPYVDGGVREIAPISFARTLGADKVYAVINSPKRSRDVVFPLRIDHIGLRALDLMTTEILNNDAENTGVDLTVIRPDAHLTHDDLEFDPKKMQNMRMIGQNKAKEVLFG
jgi:NTE family protein